MTVSPTGPPTGPTYRTETCLHVRVQTPEAHAERVLNAVAADDPLCWGDYDQVSFATAAGVQRFRTLPAARNQATKTADAVPCVELSFVLAENADLAGVLSAICAAHVYEEPVIMVTPGLRTLHIRGTGENNPHRFWNKPNEDWVPLAHRPDRL